MNSFSIVVVSYNTKKEFIKTIDSIKKQIYKNYEIIIIDGFSIDGTVDLIHEIKDKKIKFIIEKDKGIYDAMNKGIKKANKEWIIFLNSGDIFHNSSVLKKANYLINKRSNIVFGNSVIYNGNFFYKHMGEYFSNRTIRIPFNHQSVFSKTKILKKNLFDLKYKICSDFDYFVKAYKKKIIFQKINLTVATTTSGGLSDSHRFKAFQENYEILRKNKILKNRKFSLVSFFLLVTISKLVKMLLPIFIINIMLKIKYHRRVMKFVKY